jgi:outer membrane protein assembly factor BamB
MVYEPISGTVEINGTPVENAVVEAIDQSSPDGDVSAVRVTTAADGTYEIGEDEVLGNGPFHVCVRDEDNGELFNSESQPFVDALIPEAWICGANGEVAVFGNGAEANYSPLPGGDTVTAEGDFFYFADGSGNEITAFDRFTGTEASFSPFGSIAASIEALDSGGGIVAACTDGGDVFLFDAGTGDELNSSPVSTSSLSNGIVAFDISSTGFVIASEDTNGDQRVVVHSLPDGAELSHSSYSSSQTGGAAAIGATFFAFGDVGDVQVRELDTGDQLGFSPVGGTLGAESASAGESLVEANGTVFDPATGSELTGVGGAEALTDRHALTISLDFANDFESATVTRLPEGEEIATVTSGDGFSFTNLDLRSPDP